MVASANQELQILQYDGWKFSEAAIDYTREVFSSGVSSMRSYSEIINDTLIVIANVEISGDLENIFTPVFKVKNDTHKLKNELMNWCMSFHEKISENKPAKMKEKVDLALKNLEGDSAEFFGKLYIKNSKIKNIKAMNVSSFDHKI